MQIIQEATDEKPGRSKLELDGAKVLFDLLVEEISERIQGESIVTTIETLYYKVRRPTNYFLLVSFFIFS